MAIVRGRFPISTLNLSYEIPKFDLPTENEPLRDRAFGVASLTLQLQSLARALQKEYCRCLRFRLKNSSSKLVSSPG